MCFFFLLLSSCLFSIHIGSHSHTAINNGQSDMEPHEKMIEEEMKKKKMIAEICGSVSVLSTFAFGFVEPHNFHKFYM